MDDPAPNGTGDPAEIAPLVQDGGGMQLLHPGVIVMRVPQENGQEQIQVMEINSIDPLSVPLTLRMAAKIREQALGV